VADALNNVRGLREQLEASNLIPTNCADDDRMKRAKWLGIKMQWSGPPGPQSSLERLQLEHAVVERAVVKHAKLPVIMELIDALIGDGRSGR
jgi:hypothetical protein